MLRTQSENLKDRKYEIIFTSRFKRVWNKYSRSGKYKPDRFYVIMRILASGNILDSNYRDYELSGNMSSYRECHVEADLMVIYKIEDTQIKFVDFGTHSQLFG